MKSMFNSVCMFFIGLFKKDDIRYGFNFSRVYTLEELMCADIDWDVIPEGSTYDEKGKEIAWKYSNGHTWVSTYNEQGNRLTFKGSNGYSCVKTYNDKGNILTYENSKRESYINIYDENDKLIKKVTTYSNGVIDTIDY